MSADFSDYQKRSLPFMLEGVKHAFMSPMTESWRIQKSESPHGAVVGIGLPRHMPGPEHTDLFVGSLGGWLMDVWKQQELHKIYRTAHLCFDAPRPRQGNDPSMDDSLCRLFDKNQLNAIFPKGPRGRVWLITGAIHPFDIIYLCRMMRRILQLRNPNADPHGELKFCQIQVVPQTFDSRILPGDLSKRWTIKDQENGNWPQYGPRYYEAMWNRDIAVVWAYYKRTNPTFESTRQSLLTAPPSAPPSRQAATRPNQQGTRPNGQSAWAKMRGLVRTGALKATETVNPVPSSGSARITTRPKPLWKFQRPDSNGQQAAQA